MNRRSRHLVVLVVAVVTAAIASFAVYRAILLAPSQAAERHQMVVVAARPIAIGTELTARDVKVLAWPGGSPIAGAISDPKAVINRGLLTAVLENEPITVNKVAAANEGAGLSPVIPRGMRALAVRVNDVIGVAGFVVPGSRVDLVVTMRQAKGSMTRTAASNVQVLTAGTRQDQGKSDNDTKKPNASTVVTLMVTPEDAERIALAQSEGEIMLVLRNPLDTEVTTSAGVKTDSLLGREEAPEPAPVVKAAAPKRAPVPVPVPVIEPPPPPARPTVETIRQMKRTDEVIKTTGEVNK
jgi:pilus assembly protein CpaB